MTFYAMSASRRDMVCWLVLTESMILAALFYTDEPFRCYALILVPPLLAAFLSAVGGPWDLKKLRDKIEVTEIGVKYISGKETLWSVQWEDVEAFYLTITDLFWCIHIVSPLAADTDMSFQWTFRSRSAILKYCPRSDLIDQLKNLKR